MKMPIEWHEQCLANLRSSMERRQLAMHEAELALYRARESVTVLERQIARAKREGRDGFDEQRFDKPVKGK